MTKVNQQRLKEREERIERLIAYCKQKYATRYSPELFDIYYAGYDLARRRVITGKVL